MCTAENLVLAGRSLKSLELCNVIQQVNTVELGHNDIVLYNISSITSDVLWYQLIPHR